MSVDRWKRKLIQDGRNYWAVYELCKALDEHGIFDGFNTRERFEMVHSTCQACGATEKAIQEGWWEYENTKRNSA